MPHVVALYRYPVKGLAPESCTALSLLASGRVAGDRVLGVRFADTPEPDDAWSSKRGMLVLMNTPGLARLHISYRHESQRLALGFPDGAVVEAGLDDEGRRQLADALAAYAEGLDENPLRDHPEHLPLRIVGDGIMPRYHDNAAGEVTLHGARQPSRPECGNGRARPERSPLPLQYRSGRPRAVGGSILGGQAYQYRQHDVSGDPLQGALYGNSCQPPCWGSGTCPS